MHNECKADNMRFQCLNNNVGYNVDLAMAQYAGNANLYICMLTKRTGLYFADVTVNLGVSLNKDHAYVDINNLPGVDEWLESKGIAKKTGIYGETECYSYPLMIFNEDFLKKTFGKTYLTYENQYAKVGA